MKKSWFEPYVTALLTEKKKVLDSWRMQIPTLGGRTKNFENWFVVGME